MHPRQCSIFFSALSHVFKPKIWPPKRRPNLYTQIKKTTFLSVEAVVHTFFAAAITDDRLVPALTIIIVAV